MRPEQKQSTAAAPSTLLPLRAALAAIALTLSCASAAADTLAGWTAHPIPAPSSVPSCCANNADIYWNVKRGPQGIEVEKQSFDDKWLPFLDSYKKTPQYSFGKFKSFPRITREVADGTLVAYEFGEFGGAIWWFPKSSPGKRALAKRQVHPFYQVHEFFERDGELYAVEGISHMASARGTLLRLKGYGSGMWEAQAVAVLPSVPGPHAWVGPAEMLMIAGNKLIRLTLDGDRKTLYTSPNSEYLAQATSMVVDDTGVIYVGSLGAIARLTPHGETYEEEWLSKDPDFGTCKCPPPVASPPEYECPAPPKKKVKPRKR
jgi:hypothetical protein